MRIRTVEDAKAHYQLELKKSIALQNSRGWLTSDEVKYIKQAKKPTLLAYLKTLEKRVDWGSINKEVIIYETEKALNRRVNDE